MNKRFIDAEMRVLRMNELAERDDIESTKEFIKESRALLKILDEIARECKEQEKEAA